MLAPIQKLVAAAAVEEGSSFVLSNVARQNLSTFALSLIQEKSSFGIINKTNHRPNDVDDLLGNYWFDDSASVPAAAETNVALNNATLQAATTSTSVPFILLSVILSSLVICTFIGNLFVIIAILVDKNLQTAANQLVLSLAVADFMVACLVMPLGAYNDLHNGWFLGTKTCYFWTVADVLCCTGKNLNLIKLSQS